MINYIFTTRTGYTQAAHGFSGAFSWWRRSDDWRFWWVQGHRDFCESGLAVTDDFGNLVRVPA